MASIFNMAEGWILEQMGMGNIDDAPQVLGEVEQVREQDREMKNFMNKMQFGVIGTDLIEILCHPLEERRLGPVRLSESFMVFF